MNNSQLQIFSFILLAVKSLLELIVQFEQERDDKADTSSSG